MQITIELEPIELIVIQIEDGAERHRAAVTDLAGDQVHAHIAWNCIDVQHAPVMPQQSDVAAKVLHAIDSLFTNPDESRIDGAIQFALGAFDVRTIHTPCARQVRRKRARARLQQPLPLDVAEKRPVLCLGCRRRRTDRSDRKAGNDTTNHPITLPDAGGEVTQTKRRRTLSPW
jgi:hypothetical protein